MPAPLHYSGIIQERCDVRRQRTVVAVAVLLLSVTAPTSGGRQDEYSAGIEAWRTEREAGLRVDDGWLTVAGLYFLREGENSFGAGPLSDIVLPEGPEDAGIFELRNRRVTARAASGQTLTVNGEQVARTQLYPREERADLTIGDLTLFVHYSGERLAIRMRDKNSALRNDFKGLRWYPVDKSYRVPARFVPHDEPITVEMQNILGDVETFTSYGSVTLSLNGEGLKMLAVDSDSRLWFVFRDLTSGAETYAAARFLYADAPKDGWTVVDFQQSVQPPVCVQSAHDVPAPPEGKPASGKSRGGRAGLPLCAVAAVARRLRARGRTDQESRLPGRSRADRGSALSPIPGAVAAQPRASPSAVRRILPPRPDAPASAA